VITALHLSNDCLYGGYSLSGILADFGHILIGWPVMAAVFVMFRGKEAASF
jgi:hypothetical protein